VAPLDATSSLPSLPSLPTELSSLPSLPSLPTSSLALPDTSGWIDSEMLPVVVGGVLLPTGLFALLLVTDLLRDVFALVTGGAKKRPEIEAMPFTPEVDEAMAADESFANELSAWPAILGIKKAVEEMAPDEQRALKLELGTNWPPRTPTTKPFQVDREGYMFFQGPTPLTSVQDGVPSFFSSENFRGLQVPTELLVLGGLFGASFLVVAGTVVLG